MKNVAILGASGSIGMQTIDVLKNNKDKLNLVAFAVGKNIEYANEILLEFPNVELVSVLDEKDVDKIKHQKVVWGEEGLSQVAIYDKVDIVLTAVVGSAGLEPTEKAIINGKDIALANKETLVTAGAYIMNLASKYNVKIYPVDSEHSAIFQCLNGEDTKTISKIILTASGGSFRDKNLKELQNVNVDEALNHPNWEMGAKITIDSATMMNKALEVIEAHYLFDIDYEQIDVLIHKESIIHSMVEFQDFGIMAQLGTPDMRLPIQYALLEKKRKKIENSQELDFLKLQSLHFKDIDKKKYKLFYLGIEAGKKGGLYPTILNAANEIAVEMFLNKKIKYLDIASIVENEFQYYQNIQNPTIQEIKEIDTKVRKNMKRRYNEFNN